jgi:hypothetical protein
MAANDVYRKTEKGRTEIATRACKLGLRERALLIVVDDKTTRDGLLAKNSHPSSSGILDALLEQGFIEIDAAAAGAQANVIAPPSPPEKTEAIAGAAASPPGAGTLPQVEVSLNSASKFACRTLLTYLGPGADDLTAKIEKCKTVEELRTRLESCRDVVQGIAGKRKADEFWQGVSERLPPA